MRPTIDKPRLAYIVKYYYPMPRISGILRFCHDLIGVLSPDFSIRVFTYRYSPEALPREEHRGHEIVRLGKPFPFRAGRAVKAFRPDIVIFGSGFWRPCFLLPYWEIFRSGLGRLAAPVILNQHSNMTRTLSFLCGFLFPSPSAVIVPNEDLKTIWERYHPGKTRLIPPGVSLIPPGIGSSPPLTKRRKIRIGYFGHLQPHKGPDVALRVFQELKPEGVELLIHGEGEMLESLEEKAKGWDAVTFQSYVPDIRPWLDSCDFVVLPYRSAVSVLGYSRAALEALAAGIPVVTTQNPADAPLIEEGKNGFVCRNEVELKEKISLLIKDASLREKLKKGASDSARRFDINQIAAQYKTVLLNLALTSCLPAGRAGGRSGKL